MKCNNPTCNRPTFNGKSGYCSRTHLNERFVCSRCKKNPTYNHQKDGFCSITCRDEIEIKIDSPNECIAFYFPGYETEVDKIYGSGFMGNFFPCNISITAPKWSTPLIFRNAEAAFQALKFEYERAQLFCNDTGMQAFYRKSNALNADFKNSGLESNWKAMKMVLNAKFSKDSELSEKLTSTSCDVFLLEHNNKVGRDLIWSNNNNGEGRNWLGFQLMWIKAELMENSHLIGQLSSYLNLETGEFVNEQGWRNQVRYYTRILRAKLENSS